MVAGVTAGGGRGVPDTNGFQIIAIDAPFGVVEEVLGGLVVGIVQRVLESGVVGDDFVGGADACIARETVDSLADVGHKGALPPGTVGVVEVADANGDGDPSPLTEILVLHAEADIVGDGRNVGLNFDGFIIEDGDVSDDIDLWHHETRSVR